MNRRIISIRHTGIFFCLTAITAVFCAGCSFNRSPHEIASLGSAHVLSETPRVVEKTTRSASAPPHINTVSPQKASPNNFASYPPPPSSDADRKSSETLASGLETAVRTPPANDPILQAKPIKRIVVHARAANFEQEVMQSPETVLVDFYADWCGPCKRLSPILVEIAAENPQVKVVKVNIDENPELAKRYGVRALPNLLVFKDGKAISNRKGFADKDQLRSMLDL
jgi:thioredoxin 1